VNIKHSQQQQQQLLLLLDDDVISEIISLNIELGQIDKNTESAIRQQNQQLIYRMTQKDRYNLGRLRRYK